MAKSSLIFTKKKALTWIFLIAAVLIILILLRNCTQSKNDLSTIEGRTAFLRQLGWEIDPATEEHKGVRVPETLDDTLVEYNELQLKQGFDLNEHLGEHCEQYNYQITNYPDTDQIVLVTLYIQENELIAGDIHSTSLKGFMHGLTNE